MTPIETTVAIVALNVFFILLISKKPKGARKPKFAIGDTVLVNDNSGKISKMKVKRTVWDWCFEDSPFPFYRLSRIPDEPCFIKPKLGCIYEVPEKYISLIGDTK